MRSRVCLVKEALLCRTSIRRGVTGAMTVDFSFSVTCNESRGIAEVDREVKHELDNRSSLEHKDD